MLENDLEQVDARGDVNTWIEDAEGKKWDVVVDILFSDRNGPKETKFYERPEPELDHTDHSGTR